MSEDILKLKFGMPLQVQATVPENAPRYQVRVIGYQPGASIIVSTPTTNGRVQLVREGIAYNVRALAGNSVKGFSAKVLHSALKPYPHLHLEYPKAVESINVRNAQRVSVHLPAITRNVSVPDRLQVNVNGAITDLSATGAALIARHVPVASEGEVLRLTFDLQLMGTSESVTIAGKVCRIREMKGEGAGIRHFYHGLEFLEVSRYQQILLHAWVLERLATGESHFL